MEIKVFTNSDFGEVRIAVNKNKEVLFCLMDVCKALGLDNPSQVKTRLDSGNLHFVEVTTKGKNQHGEFTRTVSMTYHRSADGREGREDLRHT